LFTGREWIGEIGIYDYRNRIYSPELGRFLQTDPIRFDAGDVNLYRYVSNNPMNWVDPDGRALVLAPIAGAFLIAAVQAAVVSAVVTAIVWAAVNCKVVRKRVNLCDDECFVECNNGWTFIFPCGGKGVGSPVDPPSGIDPDTGESFYP
jgi:RHS repeat-associated protein